MSVLIEAISVVVKKRSIEERFPGGFGRFADSAPNATLCADDSLVRLGFMSPLDVQDFVGQLEACGLVYLENGRPIDMVIVDQRSQKPMVECNWILLTKAHIGDGAILVASLNDGGSGPESVALPAEWQFSGSLTEQHTFIPTDELGQRLEILSTESGVTAFRDRQTGRKVYVGSPTLGEKTAEFERIQSVVARTLELDEIQNQTRAKRDIKTGGTVFEELTGELLPLVEQLALKAKYCAGFAHFAWGLVLRVLQMPEDAVVQFEKSLSYSPNSLNTLLELTRCFGESGHPDKAKKYAQNAVEIASESPEAWGNLAMVLIELRDKESARSALSKALELAPDNSINKGIKAVFDQTFGVND